MNNLFYNIRENDSSTSYRQLQRLQSQVSRIFQQLWFHTNMINLPHIGSHGNLFWPAVQLNLSVAQKHDSGLVISIVNCAITKSSIIDKGLDELGFFGGSHKDVHDFAGFPSCMVPASSLPPGYEAGRFHSLALGCFVSLNEIDCVYFTGRLRHGGTCPLAQVALRKWRNQPYEPW